MDASFFARPASEVAEDLLGRLLVRSSSKGSLGVKITGVAAYEGGGGASRAGMLYAPGRIFIMQYRSGHLFNIATDEKDKPSCIEIRRVNTHRQSIEGSGKIAKYLDIDRDLDGILIGSSVQIIGEPQRSEVRKSSGSTNNCIGYWSCDEL